MSRVKTGGRKANTPNKIPEAVKTAIQSIVNEEIKNLPLLLDGLKLKDRADVLCKLISFVIPKQSKVELDLEITDRFKTVVVQINEPLKLENEKIEN